MAEPQRYFTGDDSGEWCRAPRHIASDRQGEDPFSFAFAKGNNDDSEYDTYVNWDFEMVDGTYEAEAYVPARSATAEVTYKVFVDSDGDSRFDDEEPELAPVLVQDEASGWRSLGTIEANGHVRIVVRNSEALDDYRDGDPADARIAIDVIRLRRVSTSTNSESSDASETTEVVSEE